MHLAEGCCFCLFEANLLLRTPAPAVESQEAQQTESGYLFDNATVSALSRELQCVLRIANLVACGFGPHRLDAPPVHDGAAAYAMVPTWETWGCPASNNSPWVTP